MTGHLYRYLNPLDSTKTLYVGQGPKRHYLHRSGRTSFGRRFKKKFSDYDLPQPIRWEVEVSSQLELNEEETIAMFQFHSWYGYDGGMNLQIPGSTDYQIMGKLGIQQMTHEIASAACCKRNEMYGNPQTHEGSVKGGTVGGSRGGKKAGAIALQTGRIFEMSKLAAKINIGKASPKSSERGIKMRDRKLGIFSQTPEQQKIAQIIGGKVASCLIWNIRRKKPCTCGKHTKDNINA